jgi:hypothetical protein
VCREWKQGTQCTVVIILYMFHTMQQPAGDMSEGTVLMRHVYICILCCTRDSWTVRMILF